MGKQPHSKPSGMNLGVRRGFRVSIGEEYQMQNPDAPQPVYIFLDESGNLDFSPNGTKYFVLTAVSMKRPFAMNQALDSYKYDCIENGIDVEYFHCYHDSKRVRRTVFGLINDCPHSIVVDCLVIEKSAISTELQVARRFYPAMFAQLINLTMNEIARDLDSKDEVIVISDTVPINRGRRAVESSVQTTLASAMPRVKHSIRHHQSRSHYGLQIADYCSWSIFRKWEMGDSTWCDQIEPLIRKQTVIVRGR